jgi:long-chain acyl-CoA synthetase
MMGSAMNVSDLLVAAKPRYAEKPILQFNGQEVSYGAFLGRVQELAETLRASDVGPGDRVILLASNSPDWVAAMFATLWIGAICVPVNATLGENEVQKIALHSQGTVAFVSPSLASLFQNSVGMSLIRLNDKYNPPASEGAERIGHPATLDAARPAFIFYTSGTTGTPKGVVLSHQAELFTMAMVAKHFAITSDDVHLVMGPLPFIFHAVLNTLSAVQAGAKIVLLPRFNPELALDAIERFKVTLTMGVPTMYLMMLEVSARKARDVSSMRLAICGGSSLPDSLRRRVQAGLKFPLFDLWGMTECTPVTSYDPKTDREGIADSCGRALPGCAIKIVNDDAVEIPVGEVGEIMLQSGAIMSGYYRNPEDTAKVIRDGWIHSGDLGKVDMHGMLYIVGRKKDMIIRGGANIYPVDIEEVLYEHPAVLECAVIGKPDPKYGEYVKTFVVAKDGFRPTSDDILAFCSQRLAAYKVPTEVEFVSELPKGPTGKTLLRKLRAC